VGRGANLILNLPPDRRGRFHETDVASFAAHKRWLDSTFSNNAMQGAKVEASSTAGRSHAASKAIDSRTDSAWCAGDSDTAAVWTARLPEPRPINLVRIRESLTLGQRIDSLAVDVRVGGEWKEWGTASSIGAQRLIAGERVVTDAVRVRILGSAAAPALAEVALFQEA